MFQLFGKRQERVVISGQSLNIDNRGNNLGAPIDLDHVFEFGEKTPVIKVYENEELTRSYTIEVLEHNADLTGQFLHSSIRILPGSAVMFDGIISKNRIHYATWTDQEYEAIRLQPFYLSDKNAENEKLAGLGLLARGLHFGGTVTPSGVRCICICDKCRTSFTLQHFHAGFSEVQYFYSEDGQETLVVPYDAMPGIPKQLQQDFDQEVLEEVESMLPDPTHGKGKFRYYNPLKCPHCKAQFIDFERLPQIRPSEYYGNTLINVGSTRWAYAGGR
jgi:hypothetical protein